MTMRLRTLLPAIALVLLAAAPARAEYQQVDLTIFGMD